MSITVTVSGATVMCETPGCENVLTIPGVHSFQAMALEVIGHHWRDDPQAVGGARRCPQCAEIGWPWCLPASGVAPDLEMYSDLPGLFAWCDEHVFSIAPPVPEWHGYGECPGGVPCLIHQEQLEPLEPAQEAAMERFIEAHDTLELEAVKDERS
jgi:hypothetical protein